MNIYIKYGFLQIFNHRKHEKFRICFIFEIRTQQPRRNRKTLKARIFYSRRALLRRYFENLLRFLRCAADPATQFAAHL